MTSGKRDHDRGNVGDADGSEPYGDTSGDEGSETTGYGWYGGHGPGATDADVGQPGPPVARQPAGEAFPDERIRGGVRERLARIGEIDPASVRVSVVNGEVTLEGAVPSHRAKGLAEDAAGDVAGATDVRNLLRVVPDPARRPTEAPAGSP